MPAPFGRYIDGHTLTTFITVRKAYLNRDGDPQFPQKPHEQPRLARRRRRRRRRHLHTSLSFATRSQPSDRDILPLLHKAPLRNRMLRAFSRGPSSWEIGSQLRSSHSIVHRSLRHKHPSDTVRWFRRSTGRPCRHNAHACEAHDRRDQVSAHGLPLRHQGSPRHSIQSSHFSASCKHLLRNLMISRRILSRINSRV